MLRMQSSPNSITRCTCTCVRILELMVLIERLLMDNSPLPDARTSHLRTLSKSCEVGLSAFLRNPVVSVEVSRTLW